MCTLSGRVEFIFVNLHWLDLSFKTLWRSRRSHLSQASIYKQRSSWISHWKWGNICLCTSIFNFNVVCEQKRTLITVLTEFYRNRARKAAIKESQETPNVNNCHMSLSWSLQRILEYLLQLMKARSVTFLVGWKGEGNSTQAIQTKHNCSGIGQTHSVKKRCKKGNHMPIMGLTSSNKKDSSTCI